MIIECTHDQKTTVKVDGQRVSMAAAVEQIQKADATSEIVIKCQNNVAVNFTYQGFEFNPVNKSLKLFFKRSDNKIIYTISNSRNASIKKPMLRALYLISLENNHFFG